MLRSVSVCEAVRLGQYLPGEVRRPDTTFRLPPSIEAVTAGAGHRVSRSLQRRLAEVSEDVTAGRTATQDVDVLASTLLRGQGILLHGANESGAKSEQHSHQQESAFPTLAGSPIAPWQRSHLPDR